MIQVIPEIKILPDLKLIGMTMEMSLADNHTRQLWQQFMPRRQEIISGSGTELYSVQVYDNTYFTRFDPQKVFKKWAAMAVRDYSHIPAGMQAFELESGLYAVFHYKGASSAGAEMFRYIFQTWLPGSGYQLDNRPHFEILGERYKNDDPESEEDICIPIKPV